MHNGIADYEEAQLRRAARINRLRQQWYGLSTLQRAGLGAAVAGALIALLSL